MADVLIFIFGLMGGAIIGAYVEGQHWQRKTQALADEVLRLRRFNRLRDRLVQQGYGQW